MLAARPKPVSCATRRGLQPWLLPGPKKLLLKSPRLMAHPPFRTSSKGVTIAYYAIIWMLRSPSPLTTMAGRLKPVCLVMRWLPRQATDEGRPKAGDEDVSQEAESRPLIPHPLEGRDDCLLCHNLDGAKPFPADHEGRSLETCQACHQPEG
jgi:hypothetical protein